MVVQACNPKTQEIEAGDFDLEACLNNEQKKTNKPSKSKEGCVGYTKKLLLWIYSGNKGCKLGISQSNTHIGNTGQFVEVQVSEWDVESGTWALSM